MNAGIEQSILAGQSGGLLTPQSITSPTRSVEGDGKKRRNATMEIRLSNNSIVRLPQSLDLVNLTQTIKNSKLHGKENQEGKH